MTDDKLQELKNMKSEGLSSDEGAPEEKVQGVANANYFESLMMQHGNQEQQNRQALTVQDSELTKKTNSSLMDQVAELNRKVDEVKRVQPTDIVAQAQEVVSRISQIKEQLALPDQTIKPAYKNILNNKLTHINDNLKIALSAAGVENIPPPTAPATNNIVDKFLGYLTDGQAQLTQVGKEVESLGNNKSGFNAAAMLAVQIKVGYVQHELEFFSSILNKALESTKSIMNVQV